MKLLLASHGLDEPRVVRPPAGQERATSWTANGGRDVSVGAEVGAAVIDQGHHRLGPANGVVRLVVGHDDQEVGLPARVCRRTDKRQACQSRSRPSQKLPSVETFPLHAGMIAWKFFGEGDKLSDSVPQMSTWHMCPTLPREYDHHRSRDKGRGSPT